MTNVVKFPSQTGTAEQVLEDSVGAYSDVMVIGFDHDGRFSFQISDGLSVSNANLLCDLMKQKVINFMLGSEE